MRKTSVIVAGTVLAATAAVSGASPASAAGSYDPNVARVANPANACKSIPGTLLYDAAIMGMPVDVSDFSYKGCVTTLAHGAAYASDINEETGEPFGDPYAQCDLLVSVGAITYPSTLHADPAEEEDMFLPDLTVKNRKECGSALYAFHAIFSTLFGGGA